MSSDTSCGTAMLRVAIIGSTGAGKTTLAAALAERLGVPHVELDSLYWEAGWQSASREAFRAKLTAALGDGWVTDGNYGQARDIVWGLSDTLIWLDMPLVVALWRVVSRTLRRSVSGEVLWNDNRETLREAIFSKDGLVLYLFSSHRRRRQEYPRLLALPEYAHLRVIRLRSPRAVERWLESVPDRAQG